MPWRLILDGPASGAWNMAVDEVLLDSHATGRAPWAATLRLYGWGPAALSFGRFQPAAFVERFLRDEGIHPVRRPTGGAAVLHEDERTYAVAGGLGIGGPPGGVLETYRRVAGAIEVGLAALGAAARSVGPVGRARPGGVACFGEMSAHEIAIEGRKLVGSAQARRGVAFLQHGSIPYAANPERTARALGADISATRVTGLAEALGGRPDDETVDRALAGAFESVLGARFVVAPLGEEERRRAVDLYTWKYLSLAWTLDRRVGDRERMWAPDGLLPPRRSA